jgi:hypothetical protein
MKKQDLKKMAMSYKQGRISRREFSGAASKLILSIPGRFNNNDADVRHEFFAHILAIIDTLIQKYTPLENVPFEAWFIFVLKRQYFAFIKKDQDKILCLSDTIEKMTGACDPGFSRVNETDKRLDLSNLTEKEKRIAALKYGLSVPDVDISETCSTMLLKTEKRKDLENKIHYRYRSMIMLESRIRSESDKIRRKQLIERNLNIRNSKRRLEFKYRRLSIYPTNKWVAGKLGVSEGTIAAYINKIRRKVKSSNELVFREMSSKVN